MITIEKEIWKPVRGFEEYAEISNFGQIHRFERVYYAGRNHKIKRIQEEEWTYGSENNKCYLQATIGGVTKGVHVWVFMTFNNCDIPEGYEVNHIDEDKHNNRLDNLNLMTPKENNNWGSHNTKVAAALKTSEKAKIARAKIAAAQTNHPKRSKAVQALDPTTIELIYEFPSTKEAQRQGFHSGSVSQCCLGKRKTHKGLIWRYVDI